jgi:hypothetical protein
LLKGLKALEGLVALVSSVLLEAVKLKFLVLLASSDSKTLASCQEQFRIRYSQKKA